ncbi:HNH endonuclease signature motif containing protein [Bacillus sp. V2I10]|uniref:HNH endonuclease signature motif containing protein n=1 Tax=Bacillus sp. V2I10 TaxID=3042276 RepID=UPI00277E78F3|nr:HNH endonuclease signature motif containing protein [Bacillus sp. V2I10]MDQ0860910.1 hypothetical protein [Bacillus sp. V2I10]
MHDTIFDATKSTITMTSTIQSITGTKPVIMLLGRDLYNGKTVDGAYSRMVGFDVEWTGAEIFAGQKATKVYTTTSTNFWISTYNTSVGWTGSYPSTSQGQTVDVLANKKAAVYPVIRNTHNNTYMWKPSIANMAVVPVELRTKRDYALPSKYKTWYIRNYGDPKWDWTTLQIHHELPLKYGGNNTMGNLFPLPTTIHQKTVTPWWASY